MHIPLSGDVDELIANSDWDKMYETYRASVSTWGLIRMLVSRLQIAEEKIAETDVVARGYITTEEMAIMLAMISSLTYKDALSKMKESLEALANSEGACQKAFNNKIRL